MQLSAMVVCRGFQLRVWCESEIKARGVDNPDRRDEMSTRGLRFQKGVKGRRQVEDHYPPAKAKARLRRVPPRPDSTLAVNRASRRVWALMPQSLG